MNTLWIVVIGALVIYVAYNFYARKVKVLSSEMESFTNDFLNLVKRHSLR